MPFIPLLSVGVIITLGLAFHSWRRRIVLGRVPLQSIGAAGSSDRIAIEGRIVASRGSVTAPLSRAAVVYYKTTMSDPKHGKPRRVEEEMVPFEIEDDSGARASVSLASTKLEVLGAERPGEGPNPVLLAMVRRQSPDATAIGTMRFSEAMLEIGQVVFVVGAARVVGHGGDEYRSSSVRLVVGAEADPSAPLALHVGSRRNFLKQTRLLACVSSAGAICLALVIALIAFYDS